MIFEELEFELFNVFITIASIIVIYFAWKSTSVREIPPTAVLIIENNRRRLLENVVRPTTTIGENISDQSIQENNDEQSLENLELSGGAPSLQDIIDEVNDLATTGNQRSSLNNIESIQQPSESDLEDLFEQNNDPGPQEIINNMDSVVENPDSAEGLRRRRLAFYAQESGSNITTDNVPNIQPEQVNSVRPNRRENLNLQTGDSTHAENCSNENNENENISKIENDRIQNESATDANADTASTNLFRLKKEEFRIKLKYLNDDLRLVKGSPQEALGDFKKRNFTVELAAEKLVRLVFNGHVLQPDTKTLQACGLFDNCVVHCLVHKKPNITNIQEETNSQHENRNNDATNNSQPGIGHSNGIRFTANGPLLVYLGIAILSLGIIFCWYCRFQYSSLFTLYSTTGLVLTTIIFLILFLLITLIERDVAT